MKTTQQKSARRQQSAATFSAFGLETLESRQLMSVTAGMAAVGSSALLASVQSPAIVMSKTPVVASAATTTLVTKSAPIVSPVKSVDLQVTAVKTSGTTPTPPPPSGGNTVMARSLWGKIKAAAKWAKDHVVIGLHHIGIKGTF
jgi:hypothetical protein